MAKRGVDRPNSVGARRPNELCQKVQLIWRAKLIMLFVLLQNVRATYKTPHILDKAFSLITEFFF